MRPAVSLLLRIAPLAVLLALPRIAGAEACAEPATTSDLAVALEEAQAAFSSLDLSGFQAATDRAAAILPCVTDPIPRHLAAEVHRYRGLRAFVDRDPTLSTKSFAAARSIEPSYRFPETLVPPGNPVLADYEAIDPETGRVETVPAPAEGYLSFDGRQSLERPASFPTVVQLFGGDGSVQATEYALPGEPLPEYEPRAEPVAATPALPGPSAPPARPDRRRPSVPLLVGAAVAGVAAGSMYALAGSTHDRYWSGDVRDEAELDRLRGTTNGLTIGAAVTGTIAVGAGAGAFLVARW